MRPTRAELLVAVLATALSACSTSSPSPTASPSPLASNPMGIPAGTPIRIDLGVEMSADNRTVTLRFIGGPLLPATNPCYTEYAGWAGPAGDVLEVAVVLVVDVHPAPGTACPAVGMERDVEVQLDQQFIGLSFTDVLFGSLGTIERATDSAPTATGLPSSPTGELTLATLLSLLVIAPENRQGYDRDLFPTWTDADGDGCNARREVLIAESLTAATVGPGCSLTGGTWYSAYDGLTFTDIADVSIDHVVALAEAWDSGASGWDAARRERFANDLGVPWTLIGVSEPSNSAKSDLDPTDWLPDDANDRCDFVADWLAVKVRWSLTVDQREHDALADLAAACPGTTRALVLADSTGGSTGVSPTPAPSPGASGCDPAYPSVCIPPPPPDLDCADVTFRRFTVLPPDPHRFDGDGNGIGCEG